MTSAILEQILSDIKEAMKARESERLTTLRSLHAQIKDAGSNAGKDETDGLVATVIAKAIKQRKDSIEQFRQGSRDDLADKEQREIKTLAKYQPEQLDETAIQQVVQKAITSTGASGKQDMGKVMSAVMPQLKGKADGKLVNQIVQRLLS